MVIRKCSGFVLCQWVTSACTSALLADVNQPIPTAELGCYWLVRGHGTNDARLSRGRNAISLVRRSELLQTRPVSSELYRRCLHSVKNTVHGEVHLMQLQLMQHYNYGHRSVAVWPVANNPGWSNKRRTLEKGLFPHQLCVGRLVAVGRMHPPVWQRGHTES